MTHRQLKKNQPRFLKAVNNKYRQRGGQTRKLRGGASAIAGVTNSTTCVSCYFPVDSKYGNKSKNKYTEWLTNTLDVKCPYVFFTNKESVDLIKKYRKDLPTHYIICEIADFHTYKYKDRLITHPKHSPSVELNLIWNEKLFMIQKAAELNPFHSEWFVWIDAGISVFRDKAPPNTTFPKEELIQALPKDKFIYSASESYDSSKVSPTNHYHHISGTYVLHKNIINRFVELYKEYIDKLFDKNNIWTDQVILTHMYKDHPDLFYKLRDGYGEVIKYLYGV